MQQLSSLYADGNARRGRLFFIVACMLSFVGGTVLAVPPQGARMPDFDVRHQRALKARGNQPGARGVLPDGHQARPTDSGYSDVQKAGTQELKGRVPDAQVDFHPLLHTPKWIGSTEGFLTGPKGQGRGVTAGSAAQFAENDPERPIKAFLQENRKIFGHGPEVLQDANRIRDFVMGAKKARTVAWEQQLDGISVYESVLIANMTGQGELITIGSQFVAEPAKAADKGHKNRKELEKKPVVSAREALVSAIECIGETVAGEDIRETSEDATSKNSNAAQPEASPYSNAQNAAQPFSAKASKDRPEASPYPNEQKHQFKAGKLPGQAQARLVWLPLDGTEMRLCWEVEVTRRFQGERFRVLVDTETGEILIRRCLTVDFREATYRVYTGESPSPLSPSLATPSTYQPPVVPRQLVTLGAISTNASPLGWIPDAGNETRGNNVDAHTDRNADDWPDLPRPQGSPFRVFDFPLDLAQNPTNYSQAAVVQLFYWCNWMHDKLYDLGFTEAAGNFQKDNLGRGGQANDALIADAQDGSGYNNANFTPTRDGASPRIQMYLFNGPNPWRDGDLDATVILHEYTHGLTDRMIAGGVGFSSGDQPYGLAEGWSDFYATALLSKPEDDPNGNYISGGYLSYRYSELRKNYYFGIRRYPYTTDMTKNPLTFKHIYYDDVPGNTNVARNPISTGSNVEVHRMGEVWCNVLWEARATLIQKVGSVSEGNKLMLQLTTEALPYTQANPTFIQARDGIFTADRVHHESTNIPALWAAFAKRGMGARASTWELPLIGADVTEDFSAPGALQVLGSYNPSGPVGGPFTPASVSWTLRNSGQYEFQWSAQASTNWLDITPTDSGWLGTNSSTNITLTINSNANVLPKGTYTNILRFINLTASQIVTQWVYLQIDQGGQITLSGGMYQDVFYHARLAGFSNVAFQNISFTFTPDAFTNLYSICKYPANAFPTDPTGGQTVVLVDDSYRLVELTNGMEVSIYNVRSNKFFIGSNGDIDFVPPPAFVTNSEPDFYTDYFHPNGFFENLKAAPLYADLNPGVGGTVSWKQMHDHVAITYDKVPEYGINNSNSFQVELYTNGVIRYTYLDIQASDAIPMTVQIGFSRGLGAQNYQVTDLIASSSCYGYELEIPAHATEGDGVLQGTLRLAMPVWRDTIFRLMSSDTNAVTVDSLTVSQGVASATFPLLVRDDNLLNGSRVVTITAESDDYDPISANIEIADDEMASLYVVVPGSAVEGQGVLASAGMVSVSARPDAPITVRLSSSNPSVVAVPNTVIIPSNQFSANFDITILDDVLINDSRSVTIEAAVENWISASNSIQVADNEDRTLTLLLPAHLPQTSGTHPGAGVVQLSGVLPTNFVVQLVCDSPGVLSVPDNIIIPAGTNAAAFDMLVIDNQQANDLLVTLYATAAGFRRATGSVAVGGVEIPSAPVGPTPLDDASKVPMLGNTLAWGTAQPESPGSVNFEVYFSTNANPGTADFRGITNTNTWTLSQKLLFSTTYYWQIVATRGPHRVPGPVWRFTTVRLSHFEVSQVPSPQRFRVPFDLTVTAKAENLEAAVDFEGPVSIQGLSPAPDDAILISEVDVNSTTPRVEFVNVSGHDIEISGWQVSLYDWVSWPDPRTTFTVPGRVMCGAGEVFVVNRSVAANYPGNYPNFMLGTNLGWNVTTIGNPIAVLLQDNNGKIIDFMCAADAVPSQITRPVAIPAEQWLGPPMGASLSVTQSFQRQGMKDLNGASDWVLGPPNISTRNPGLTLPFVSSRAVAVLPAALSNFMSGVWSGQVSVAEAGSSVALQVEDDSGRTGTNAPFAVVAFDNLALTVAQPLSVPRLGGTFDYQLLLYNNGPTAATGVQVRDVIPATTEFIAASASQGGCSNVSGQLVCDLGTLNSNEAAQVTLTLRAAAVGYVTNNAMALRAEPFLPNTVQTITWVEYPWLSLSKTNIREGDTNAEFSFPVKLSNPSVLPVSVNYFTMDGSARDGVDYVGVSGRLEFAPGETNANIGITFLGNHLMESNKTFTITLTQASNAVVAASPVLITIVNDDNSFTSTVNIWDTSVQEGDDGMVNAVFTVSLTQPLLKPLSIYYNTVDGTATANLDYIPVTGKLELAAGVTNKTISVPVLGDRLYESNETFQVKLTFADIAYIARTIGTATIIDDDAGQLHHFTWTLNGSTQFANAPFPATVTAVDALGRRLTDYNTTVSLRAGRQVQQLTVGSGANTWSYPLGAGYQDQRLQVLYQASQIGRAGRISSLALRVSRPPGQALNSWTIRLKNCSLTNFQSSQVWQDFSEPPAYHSDELLASGGWVTFQFQRPFDYNGTDSLLVDFSFHNELSSNDGICWATTNTECRALGFYTDGGYGDPRLWSGTTPQPIPLLLTPQIRFGIDSALSVLPVPDSQHVNLYPPGDILLINGSWSGNLALQGEALNGSGGSLNFSDVVLSAIDCYGHVGASSTLNFIPFQPMLQKIGSDTRLSFPTIPGQNYEVDGANDLAPGSWLNVSGPITGTGVPYEVTYPIVRSMKFYRVKIVY